MSPVKVTVAKTFQRFKKCYSIFPMKFSENECQDWYMAITNTVNQNQGLSAPAVAKHIVNEIAILVTPQIVLNWLLQHGFKDKLEWQRIIMTVDLHYRFQYSGAHTSSTKNW